MKKILLLIIILTICGTCKKEKENILEKGKSSDLTIYLTESIMNHKGWNDFFENKNIEVKRFANSLELAQKLYEEPLDADLVIGLDNTSCSNFKIDSLFCKHELDVPVIKSLEIDDEGYLIPYGYNYLAFIYRSGEEYPKSFGEIQDSKWNQK
ncbi:MAG: hypothetical protein SVM86_06240, partial [Candidatus Cloacimonadota bacterium]|nr:hypothetical protein [Candidatus Cloacimonadota bacterium]